MGLSQGNGSTAVAVPSDRFGSQEVEGAEEAEGEPWVREKQDAEAGRGPAREQRCSSRER